MEKNEKENICRKQDASHQREGGIHIHGEEERF
jgi:hypothetical protein